MTFPYQTISERLSQAEDIEYQPTAIVIGSGYGGAVAASRLARMGIDSVVVLERGREIAPGGYPRDPKAAADEMQITLSRTGQQLNPKRDCLFDMRIGDDMTVLVGNGLGGTSLINANVAIEPDARVYQTWPKPFRESRGKVLDEYYRRAREMLGSNPYPAKKTPPKMAALQKVAEGLNAPFVRPDINVSFKDGFNHAAVWQAACTDCGDCVSGCNYGAKNTTLMNYLPDAAAFGALIYTGAEVMSLHHDGTLWVVNVRDIDADETASITAPFTAEIVVLAAGTLGSNEILMRSSQDHCETGTLSFSDRLGDHFSGNGDIWAFGYNANIPTDTGRAPVHGVGAGIYDVSHGPTPPGGEKYKPGPCITGMVDLRDPNKPLSTGVIIEEGVMPGALAPAYAVGFPALSALLGDPFRFGDTAMRLQDAKDMADTLEKSPLEFVHTVAYDGTVSRTMPFLVMSHDSSGGQLALNNNRVTVNWQGAGTEDAILHDEKIIRKACDAIQAEYLPLPTWQEALDHRLLSVHPLGGCAMADGPDKGVVNYKCQVFDPDGDVHKGLYVCDGAAMPRGLGVNPHLTITAVAEYAMAELAKDKDWTLNLAPSEPSDWVPRPIEELNIVEELEKVIAGLSAIKAAIDGKAFELACQLLLGLWRQIFDLYAAMGAQKDLPIPTAEEFVDYIGDPDTLADVAGPILAEMLDALIPITENLRAENFLKAFEAAEEKLGDFSPPAAFEETMSGRLSIVGLSDDDPAFDPYATAADGETNCRLTASITADAVRTATGPGGSADINGVLISDDLGTFEMTGAFRLFVQNTDHIERWQMHYDGKLTGERDLTFEGFKILQHREGSHWWRDLNDLRVDIKDGQDVIARGILSVGLESAMAQANNLVVEYKDLSHAFLSVYQQIKSTDKSKLLELAKNRKFRATFTKALLFAGTKIAPDVEADTKLAEAYRTKVFARFGTLVLRTYGGVFAYMMNFPANAPALENNWEDEPVVYYPEVEPGVFLKLTRYQGGKKGPVILAGGFGTKASSFATPTIDENLVQKLTSKGYDVWLFDYRGSGDIEASQTPFTLDDVATKDWPAAIDLVTARTGAKDVQVLVHCIGSLTLFMAVLAGEKRVRSIISSQLAAHAITNWFKYAQNDAGLGDMVVNGASEQILGLLDLLKMDDSVIDLAKAGMPVIDPRSPKEPSKIDQVIDALLWDVPAFAPVPCYSPTCHRINFFFGPSYRHEQLNQDTHNAIKDMFGPVASAPFLHIAKMMEAGKVIGNDASFDYFEHPERLSMPIHFIAGAKNQEMLPEATLRTQNWLIETNGEKGGPYTRHVYPEYGHMDVLIGKTASKDIFRDFVRELDRYAIPKPEDDD